MDRTTFFEQAFCFFARMTVHAGVMRIGQISLFTGGSIPGDERITVLTRDVSRNPIYANFGTLLNLCVTIY